MLPLTALMWASVVQRLLTIAVRCPTQAGWHHDVIGPTETRGLERRPYEVLRSKNLNEQFHIASRPASPSDKLAALPRAVTSSGGTGVV